MLGKLILLAAFATMPSMALAEKVTVFNSTGGTIYKVFAWPEKLNPRSFNVLGFPLFPGSKTEVNVDSANGDCLFKFHFDANDPSRMRLKQKKGYRKKPFGIADANVCGTNIFVWLGPIPYGKIQGKP